MAKLNTREENIRKAKDLWDSKQNAKFARVRKQQERTAARTPEQIEIQKQRKEVRRAERRTNGK